MKNFVKVVSCLMIIMLVCGCGKKEKVALNNEDSVKDNLTKVKVNCEEIQDIKDFSYYNNLFITKKGKLYQINFSQLFSNDKNCREIKSEIRFKKIIRGGIIGVDNNVYYFDANKTELVKFDFQDGYLTMPYINNIEKDSYENIFSAPNKAGEQNYFWVDRENNKIYMFEETLQPSNLKKEAILTLEQGENIEYVVDNLIKTNRAIYTFQSIIINKDECDKYADVDCKYTDKFEPEKITKEEFDQIKFMYKLNNFKMVIMKKGEIYVDLNNYND